jgi:hypothetical protein
MENIDDLFRIILDDIERRENSLLVWGVVDCFSTEIDILDIIQEITDNYWDDIIGIDEKFTDAQFVLDKLLKKCLLFEVPFTEGGRQFRSRMAETVRLLFHLRQLFPQHAGEYGWTAANTLVADYRFKRSARTYPERNLLASDFIEKLGEKNTEITTALECLSLKRPEVKEFKLAEFQLQATKAILDSVEAGNNRGILISAGTGSGKTLAFYLPALARISYLIQQEEENDRWVKAVAIYPRNELLKDQFKEVYSEARLLDDLLEASNKRKIQIAALFGPTPSYARGVKNKDEWVENIAGYICPFINCIKCGNSMVWRNADLNQNKEVLHCLGDDCSFVINDDEIILTRNRISLNPPDILFTSTEMMNQNLGNPKLKAAYGASPNAKKPPEMMLLDEIHTYQSFSGAQIAFLLRRWKNAIGSPVTFIGLSATLKDGEVFFSKLCGLENGSVNEIKPLPSHMEKEGAEYTIALRGDPVSRSALLSTTIQTAMLLSRSLDERGNRVSDGIYGTKLFAFTDKLDVINRLEPNLLDAEGRDRYGNPLATRPLAQLRELGNNQARYENGQDWRMCRSIGHHLGSRKNISKVSSQDPGVNLESDIIAATATLEIGFNDTNVGAVIQHKAPRGMAQFVQRKGRAGRSRKMRPWTAVVLSDYGRDRLLYMAYEQLFDPELPANSLPTSNRYIARIQAVYCLLEYLSKETQKLSSNRNIWKWLSEPFENSGTINQTWLEKERKFSKALRQILSKILEDPVTFDEFSTYLCQSLQITEEELHPILWDYPRPLITTVIPTALRRLNTNWHNKGEEKSDYFIPNSPLPEFATANLFSDLNLPEVTLKMPSHQPGDDATMSVSQAMREFAPGRISKRFSATANLKHWVSPESEDLVENKCLLEITNSFELSELGIWPLLQQSEVVLCPVFRVLSIQLEQADKKYSDTCNARLDWHTQILATERGTPLGSPSGVPLENLIEDLQLFTHQDENPIEIRRFSNRSTADIKLRQAQGFRTRIDFVREGVPSAIGMFMTVDGFRIKLRSTFNFVDDLNLSKEAIRGLRTARYLSEARKGENFATVPNPFVREWLANVYMTAVIHQAISTSSTLRDAANKVYDGNSELSLTDVLDTIFQSNFELDLDAEDQVKQSSDILRTDLNNFLTTPETLVELQNLVSFLWSDIDQNWNIWLRERTKVTLAGGIYYTIQHLCPQIDIENLVVDICPGPRGDGDIFSDVDINHEIWISETSPGGNGLIEAFTQSFNNEPGLFYKLLHSSLEANEFEVVDEQLTRYLNQQSTHMERSPLYESVSSYRSTQSIKEQDAAFTNIRHSLSQDGYSVFHSFLSSFSTRIMRPGSNEDTDGFFKQGINKWKEEEESLNIEIDARIFAYYWSQHDEAENFTASFGFHNQNQGPSHKGWLYNVIYGMFWPRGRLARESGLRLYNEFNELPDPERLLFSNLSSKALETVQSSSEDWLEETTRILQEKGSVIVEASSRDQDSLSVVINKLIVHPIEVSYLKSYARIVELERSEGFVRARLELPEIFL